MSQSVIIRQLPSEKHVAVVLNQGLLTAEWLRALLIAPNSRKPLQIVASKWKMC